MVRDLGPDGRLRDAMEITFTSGSGVTASVRVPLTEYTPDRVAQVIGDYAAKIDAVHALGHP
jgi:hypothetical protein